MPPYRTLVLQRWLKARAEHGPFWYFRRTPVALAATAHCLDVATANPKEQPK